MKHFFFPMVMLLALLTACSNNPEPSNTLESISLNKKKISIEVGEDYKLRVIYEPSEAEDHAPEVVWESDKTKVATVDDKGVVVGKSVGKATITATCGKFVAECEVEVVPEPDPVPVENISLSETTLEIKEGQSYHLEVVYDPAESKRWADPIEWSSSEENVATVDNNGHVEALLEGNTVITAKCGSLSAKCNVTVIAAGVKITPSSLEFNVVGGEQKVQLRSNTSWSSRCSESWLSVSPGSGEGNAELTVTVEAGDMSDKKSYTANIVFTNSDMSATLTVVRLGASVAFSVSATKKIEFAPGNLQYQASTKTWRFAAHQYTFVGDDNKNISDTYDGWIDLFGWGTGKNPTNYSTLDSEYQTFNEWGANKISNSAEATGTWFTLSEDEWDYILRTRENAWHKYFAATVNNVHGCILLPDNCILPSEIPFDTSPSGWSTNNYTLDTWERMEKLGAVFLPACGYRDAKTVKLVGDQCFYWTSTYKHYFFHENNGNGGYISSISAEPRFGQAVRLAKVAK